MGLFRLFLFRNIGITEYTEYQFPIKQIAHYSENRIADVIKRDRHGRAIFPPKYHSAHSAIRSSMNGIAFHSFWNRNSSQKNTSTVYSGIGINGIVPKERALSVGLEIVARELPMRLKNSALAIKHFSLVTTK